MAPPRDASAPTDSWKTLKGLINETVGPLAVLTYGATKFVSALAGAALNAEKMRAALNASSEASTLIREFQGIGLSAEQARVKVSQLTKEASRGGFNLDALGQASKILQILGGESLNTAANLRKIKDASAATGAPLDVMATALGSLIQSLKTNGDGAAAAAASVASFGVISQQTAQKIAQLTAAGAPLSSSMRLVESDLKRTKGASLDLASSLTGLKARLASLSQESNAKIGDIYLDGEKSALRAAIGFEKVKNTVDETAASFFGPLRGAINSAIEWFSKLVSSSSSLSAIKGVIGTLAAAASGLLATAILATTAGLVRMVFSLGRIPGVASAASGALSVLSRVSGAYFAILGTGVGAASLIAGAIAAVGFKAYEAAAKVEALNKSLQQTVQGHADQLGSLERRSGEVVTPEDKKRTLSEYDSAIDQNKEDQKNAADAVKKAEKAYRLRATIAEIWNAASGGEYSQKNIDNNVQNASGAELFDLDRTGDQLQIARANEGAVRNQGIGLRNSRQRLADNYKIGLSSEQDQKARDLDLLEEKIRREAFSRLSAATSPQAAVTLAEEDRNEAADRLARAHQYSEAYRTKDSEAIGRAQQGVAAAETPSDTQVAFDRLRDVSSTQQTSRGKIEADLAYRQSLLNERNSAKEALFKSTAVVGPEGAQLRKSAQDRLSNVQQRVQALGGEEKLAPAAIQELQRKSAFEAATNDPVARREELEDRTRSLQLAKEAAAQAEAAIRLEQEKVRLEQQFATAAEGTAAAVAKASAEGELEASRLQRALVAAQALEAAQAAYASASSRYQAAPTPENKAALDSAFAVASKKGEEASAAGAQGRSASELSRLADLNKQITQEKIRQADLAKAAAEGEAAAALRRLNTERLLLQLRQGLETQRTGGATYKGPNEGQIQIRSLEAELAVTRRALVVAREKEAADGNNPGLAKKKEQELAQLGFKGQTSLQIATQVAQLGIGLSSAKIEQRQNVRDIFDRQELSGLRARLDLPGNDYQQVKQRANALEDSIRTREKEKQYREQGIDVTQGAGKDLVASEVKSERLQQSIAELGELPVSDLQRIGGERRSEDPRRALLQQLKEEQGRSSQARNILRDQLKSASDQSAAKSAPGAAAKKETSSPADASQNLLQQILKTLENIFGTLRPGTAEQSAQKAPAAPSSPSEPVASSSSSASEVITPAAPSASVRRLSQKEAAENARQQILTEGPSGLSGSVVPIPPLPPLTDAQIRERYYNSYRGQRESGATQSDREKQQSPEQIRAKYYQDIQTIRSVGAATPIAAGLPGSGRGIADSGVVDHLRQMNAHLERISLLGSRSYTLTRNLTAGIDS